MHIYYPDGDELIEVGDTLCLFSDDNHIILRAYKTDETRKPYSVYFDSSQWDIYDGPADYPRPPGYNPKA